MKKLIGIMFLFMLIVLVGCQNETNDETTTIPEQSTTTTEEPYVYEISDPALTKDSFSTEPMRTEVKEIDQTNVVFQYDQPVPSFDTWETQEESRNHMTLNSDWLFKTDPDNVGVTEQWYSPFSDFTSWETRPVPSSWDTYDYSRNNRWGQGFPFYDGYAWYKRNFTLDDNWDDQYIKLNFLGVHYRAWVYVNGQYVDVHESGNTSFSLDISEHVKSGENTIVVRVYRRPDFHDYYAEELQTYWDDSAIPNGSVDYWPYAGITRDVYLEGTNKITVSKILTNSTNNNLEIFGVIYNTDEVARTVKVSFDPGANTGGSSVTETVTVEPNSVRVVKKEISIPNAKEWSYVEPNLYTAYVRLYDENDNHLDELHVDYGMRRISILGTKLLLNGQQIFLKGTNWHEETKLNGRSMTKEEYDLELGLIKQMNMNFIRNSHYNRHKYAYEYTDKNGILMMDETENMWLSRNAIDHQYYNYHLSRAAVMMTTWNNMNHPSIIIWSLSNEVSYDGSYVNWIKELYDTTKLIDVQKRPVSWGAVNTNDPAFQYADIIGFNEYAGFFWGENEDLTGVLEDLHRRYPNKPLLITENGSWSSYGNSGSQNVDGTEQWQAAGFRSHYTQTVAKKDYMVGYTFWVLKDYKTRRGYNRNSIGISTMGTVIFDYTQDFVDGANSFGVKPHKAVFYAIRDAENPYVYTVEE